MELGISCSEIDSFLILSRKSLCNGKRILFRYRHLGALMLEMQIADSVKYLPKLIQGRDSLDHVTNEPNWKI